MNALDNVAQVAFLQGDPAAARAALEEALGLARALNYRQGIARLLAHLGQLAVDRGDYAAARGLYEDALARLTRLGARQGIADLLEGLAERDRGPGQPERSLALGERPVPDRWLAPARASLSPGAQAAAWAAGQAMTVEQAVAAALEEAPAAA